MLRQRRPPLHRLEVTASLTADALNVEGVLEALPRVTEARLLGLSALPALSTPALQSLQAWLSVLTIDEASAQALLARRASFPRLTQLEARFFRTSQAVEARVRAAFP